MKKQVTEAFGKKIYLLGEDQSGARYWLEEPSWDCGWYWGFGYVETYTNNRNPSGSRDIASHGHFDHMFLSKGAYAFDEFKGFFKDRTLSDDEIWKLLDFMSSAYKLSKAADLFQHGFSNYTGKAKLAELTDEGLADRINKEMLPKLFEKTSELLTDQAR